MCSYSSFGNVKFKAENSPMFLGEEDQTWGCVKCITRGNGFWESVRVIRKEGRYRKTLWLVELRTIGGLKEK